MGNNYNNRGKYNRNNNYNSNIEFNHSFDEMNSNFRNQYDVENRDFNNGYDNYYNNNYFGNNYLDYNREDKEFSSAPPKKKAKYKKILFPVIILLIIIIPLLILIILNSKTDNSFFDSKKTRTFMIYMVGSDLESKNRQGTYSISDIDGEKIDLEHNNVILMVGGSKKWHNFVDSDEIGIYELTSAGFAKRKSFSLVSMGISETLSTFLDYVYSKYPAKKYDMIFWNHGLGAMGVEQDEIANDYLSIQELDNAFINSPFESKKLELTIFYNCLSSNLHIANIMSKYSNYMVASEEVFYLSKVLNRLNFLEKVKTSDDAYKVAYYFIEQSDKVVNAYNSSHPKKIDSTLSILDLSKIEELNEKVNSFISSINVTSNYSKISSLRRGLFTYGRVQTNDYDTVDLYQLVSALTPVSSSKLSNDVLRLIDKTVMYTSNLNDHSNGISIYFPFYGSDRAVEIHLNSFRKLWNDSYYSFINNFYQIRKSTKLSIRAKTGNNINMLTNHLKLVNNSIELELTDEEKEKYQYATIYLFNKDSDKYDLLVKSDRIYLENNVLRYDDNFLLSENNNYFTYSYLDNNISSYGELSDFKDYIDVIFNIDISGYDAEIIGTLLDSKDYPIAGLMNYNEYDSMKLARLRYDLVDEEGIREDWKETEQRILFEVDKDNLNSKVVNNTLDSYYVLIELYDENNDIYYSNLERVEQ